MRLQTDRQTDGQTDGVIPGYPPNFVAGGIKISNFIVKWWKTAGFVEHKPNSAGKRHVFHDVIIAFLESSRQRPGSWRYHDVKTIAKWPKGIGVM